MHKTKVCIKCGIEKELSKFCKDKSRKDGFYPHCTDCRKELYIENKEKYPWRRFLKLIKKRCNNPKQDGYKYYGGKGIKCDITYDDLELLWVRDKAYEMNTPSIDRINSNKNYTLENCQFLEHIDNSIKRDKSNMIKPVLQYDLKDKFIREFSSLTIATNITNINNSSISACARGIRKTAGGFKWLYKKRNHA